MRLKEEEGKGCLMTGPFGSDYRVKSLQLSQAATSQDICCLALGQDFFPYSLVIQ